MIETGSRDAGAITAATVQFISLPLAIEALGRRLEVTEAEGSLSISF